MDSGHSTQAGFQPVSRSFLATSFRWWMKAGFGTTATVFWLLLLVSALAGFDTCFSAEPPWPRHTIDNATRGADGVRLADVNGDGLPDIVTGWEEGGVTRICINPGPAKAREPWKAFTVGKTVSVEDAVLVDLDGDGRLDVVTCCEGKTRGMFVHWAPDDMARYSDEQAWKTEALPAAQDRMMWMFCRPMQVDGRNGVDLVAVGKGKGAALGWFEAPEQPRDLSAWKWHPWLDIGWGMALRAEDMDGDGDADVLVSNRREPSRGVFWMENPGPEKARDVWSRHPIGGEDVEVMFLNIADLDGDGLKDVLCAGKPQRVLFFRRKTADGRGWERHEIVWPEDCGTAKAVAVGDIDGNGKPDVVYTCEHAEGQKSGCRWLSFRETPLEKDWTAHEIAGQEGVKFDLVELLDLDGDGDLDVLTCAEIPDLGVFWYENPRK